MQITRASGADFMLWILWSVIVYVNTDFPTCYISRLKPLKFDVFFLLCGWHTDTDSVFAGTLPRATLWCIPATAVKKCPPVRRRWRCSVRMARRKRATTFQLRNVDASWKNVVNQTKWKTQDVDSSLGNSNYFIWVYALVIFLLYMNWDGFRNKSDSRYYSSISLLLFLSLKLHHKLLCFIFFSTMSCVQLCQSHSGVILAHYIQMIHVKAKKFDSLLR